MSTATELRRIARQLSTTPLPVIQEALRVAANSLDHLEHRIADIGELADHSERTGVTAGAYQWREALRTIRDLSHDPYHDSTR